MSWNQFFFIVAVVFIIFSVLPFGVIIWYCDKKDGDVDDMVDISAVFLIIYAALIGALAAFLMNGVLTWNM